MSNVFCVAMAGGIGSRFWPMSRQNMPKQYLDILGTGSSLIQLTYERFRDICPQENFCVVTSRQYAQITKEHLPALNNDQLLLEPSRRNTAPCIAYAAHKLYEKNPNSVMVITPADHIILKQEAFQTAVKAGIEHAEKTGRLVTLGIEPTRPDSGYGYIQFHSSDKLNTPIRKVKTFTEKPSVEMALKFLQSGDFYWNSGMFIWKTSAILEAFENHLPAMAQEFEIMRGVYGTANENAKLEQVYSQCDSISIDYGIMEKADNVDVVLGQDFGWSDLGTWGSLYDQMAKSDRQNNVTLADNVRMYDSQSTIAMIPKNKLAVIQGLDNYIVVDTNDALLICQKGEEQKIKQFVSDLKSDGKSEFL